MNLCRSWCFHSVFFVAWYSTMCIKKQMNGNMASVSVRDRERECLIHQKWQHVHLKCIRNKDCMTQSVCNTHWTTACHSVCSYNTKMTHYRMLWMLLENMQILFWCDNYFIYFKETLILTLIWKHITIQDDKQLKRALT